MKQKLRLTQSVSSKPIDHGLLTIKISLSLTFWGASTTDRVNLKLKCSRKVI